MTGKPAIDGVKSEILDLETLESPEDVECRDFPNFPKEIKGSQWVEILLWSRNSKYYTTHLALSTCFYTEKLFIHLCLALFYDKSVMPRVSVQGVESLWGDCSFIPVDWGS